MSAPYAVLAGTGRLEGRPILSRHRTGIAALRAIEREFRAFKRQPGNAGAWLDRAVVRINKEGDRVQVSLVTLKEYPE